MGIENFDSLSETSPEIQALQWLLYEDSFHDDFLSSRNGTDTAQMLRERYALVVFYYSTDGPSSWNEKFNFLSATSVCSWNGIDNANEPRGTYCNDEERVVEMNLCTL